MKKKILSIIFISLVLIVNSDEINHNDFYERIYIFKIIAFYKRYEIFCTLKPMGYYKYKIDINEYEVYLTYETKGFYNQCTFDENLTVFEEFYASNMWSKKSGEIVRFKKKYSPVIDKNRKIKNYPHGFGKN